MRPKILNSSTCFNDTPPACREHGTGFLGKCITSVLKVLIFIPAIIHAAGKPLNTCWRPDTNEASKTKSFAKSNRLILDLSIGCGDVRSGVVIKLERQEWNQIQKLIRLLSPQSELLDFLMLGLGIDHNLKMGRLHCLRLYSDYSQLALKTIAILLCTRGKSSLNRKILNFHNYSDISTSTSSLFNYFLQLFSL